MKVLVTGAKGQLGSALTQILIKNKVDCLGTDICDFDIRNQKEASDFILNYKPTIIVHCASYTNVEQAENEIDNCNDINILGTEVITKAAVEVNSKIVYISTDYVFSGDKIGPYDIYDEKNPLNVYGRSKSEGEEIVKKYTEKFYIVRTSWMFGNGKNFVKTILQLSEVNSTIKVVNDQIGSPTYAEDLASFIFELIQTDKFGIYHVTNEGFCTWAEFAEYLIKMMKKPTIIERVRSEELPYKAKRPKNSLLSKICLDDNNFKRLPYWQDALERYLFKREI